MNNQPDLPWMHGGQRAVAFVREHGGNPAWDRYTRRFLLPDGAQMTLDGLGTAPPPADPMRALNARRLYWQLVIERTEAHLGELATVSRGEAMTARWRVELYGPKPGPKLDDAWAHLTKLLAKYRKRLAEVDAELHRIHVQTP